MPYDALLICSGERSRDISKSYLKKVRIGQYDWLGLK
jgi:hypothetical protein